MDQAKPDHHLSIKGSTSSEAGAGIATALAFLVVCNLPFLAASQAVFLSRALINIDYAAAGMLAMIVGSPALLFIALPLVFAVDLIFSFSPAYHFSPASAWQALQELGRLDRTYVFVVAMGMAAVVAVLSLAAGKIAVAGMRGSWINVRALSFVLTLLVTNALPVLMDGNPLAADNADVRSTATNHAGSTINNLALAWKTRKARVDGGPDFGNPDATAASKQLQQLPPPER
ncbi:MAG: hypothetical protein M0Q42_10770 [Xanthomonadales bacterium]|nr:hypothetical protein [Xanthomonadales bacterium]